VEYAYYGFDSYAFRGASIPEVRFTSATGEASNVWRLFADVKMFPHTSKAVLFYLSTGIGYLIERVGTISATFEDMNGRNFSTTIKYESTNFLVHTLGLGIRWGVLSDLALDFKGQYFTNYNDRMYTTVKCGLVYSVNK
jgi:hypothetical protein